MLLNLTKTLHVRAFRIIWPRINNKQMGVARCVRIGQSKVRTVGQISSRVKNAKRIFRT